jgi:hypothetical protein
MVSMRGFPITALLILVSSAAIAQTPTAPAAPPPPLVAPAAPPAPPALNTPTPPPAMAPAPSAAAPAATAPDGISRDDYIAKARDEAAKRAGDRFDAMDANHDGILTKAEIAAYHAAHARKKAAPEPQ